MKTTTDQLAAFVRRGQAAQPPTPYQLWKQSGEDMPKYVALLVKHGLVIADVDVDVSQFPPWRRCQLPGCHAWTRGETCPLHREAILTEGPARQGAPGLPEQPPRGSSGSVGGAYPARGRTATAKGSTQHNGGRKRNARKT